MQYSFNTAKNGLKINGCRKRPQETLTDDREARRGGTRTSCRFSADHDATSSLADRQETKSVALFLLQFHRSGFITTSELFHHVFCFQPEL